MQRCGDALFNDNLFKSILFLSAIQMPDDFPKSNEANKFEMSAEQIKIHKFTLPFPSHSHLIKTRARKRNSYQ